MTCFINFGVARHFAYRGCADLFKRTTKFRVYPHMLTHVAKSTNYSIFQEPSTMAKERSTDKEAADSKREKHSKSKKEKEKRSDKDSVHKSSKSSSSIKKVKPEKIKARAAATTVEDRKEEENDVTNTLLDTLNEEDKKPSSSSIIASAIAKEKEKDTQENGISSVKVKIKPMPPLLGALVPFAHPLADEKVQKKVFKIVKKGLSCSNPVPLFYIKQNVHFPLPNCHYLFTLHISLVAKQNFSTTQLRKTNPSNEASKKSSNLSANPPPE